jgi:chromosome segregation ATPase
MSKSGDEPVTPAEQAAGLSLSVEARKKHIRDDLLPLAWMERADQWAKVYHRDAKFLLSAHSDLAQQLEQAERENVGLRRKVDNWRDGLNRRDGEFEQAEQRIKELEGALEQIRNETMKPNAPITNEWYWAVHDEVSRLAQVALQQDSATAEATQEPVVREDSDEG